MANVASGGIRPWGTVLGGEGNYPAPIKRELANNYGTALYCFDPIKSVSDGTVAQSAAGDILYGVAVGFEYVTGGRREKKPYIPANTTFSPTTVGSANASWVWIVPARAGVLFRVQGDEGTSITTIAAAVGNINESCDHVIAAGDTTTGITGTLLDISTHAAASGQWRIYQLVEGPANDVTITRAEYIVEANEAEWPEFTATGI